MLSADNVEEQGPCLPVEENKQVLKEPSQLLSSSTTNRYNLSKV
ncbi:unnamed protein product [Haemonchus placei]|uniref:Uncharacterized protein n=1 Tax=Haemonchus placei TaxID=6290 RepID=A0A0N4X3R2_HAEPC|nr:unnamed protein product [Haemonchus placei]